VSTPLTSREPSRFDARERCSSVSDGDRSTSNVLTARPARPGEPLVQLGLRYREPAADVQHVRHALHHPAYGRSHG
jgi:hypothetical protein